MLNRLLSYFWQILKYKSEYVWKYCRHFVFDITHNSTWVPENYSTININSEQTNLGIVLFDEIFWFLRNNRLYLPNFPKQHQMYFSIALMSSSYSSFLFITVYIQGICKVVISVCPIITQEPQDRFTSN